MTDDEWQIDPRYKGTLYDQEAHPLMPLDDKDIPIEQPYLEGLWGKTIKAITKTGAEGRVRTLTFTFTDDTVFQQVMDERVNQREVHRKVYPKQAEDLSALMKQVKENSERAAKLPQPDPRHPRISSYAVDNPEEHREES